MTDERTGAIPFEAFADPVLAYTVDGSDARITTTNESFERQFEEPSAGDPVSVVFERFDHRVAAGDRDPTTHVVRGDRVGIYLDDTADRGAFFARVIPVDGDTGYLVLSDLRDCPAAGTPAAVDQVSSVISHDLRNPLDVAKAHLQAARETGDPEHFESVTDAHDRMERIIRDALTLTRGNDAVDPSDRVSIETAATDAWRSVDTGGATLDLDGSLPVVTADADRVRRLFENLFRNSVEHGSTGNRTESGDSVEGDAADDRTGPGESAAGEDRSSARGDGAGAGSGLTITVGTLTDGIYVADDGTGVPADERETVFEPGHSSTDGGTGLGLAIVDRIIAAHDWDVTLTTADGGGARFEIRF